MFTGTGVMEAKTRGRLPGGLWPEGSHRTREPAGRWDLDSSLLLWFSFWPNICHSPAHTPSHMLLEVQIKHVSCRPVHHTRGEKNVLSPYLECSWSLVWESTLWPGWPPPLIDLLCPQCLCGHPLWRKNKKMQRSTQERFLCRVAMTSMKLQGET